MDRLKRSAFILVLLAIGQFAAIVAPVRAVLAIIAGNTDQAMEIAKGYDLLGNTATNGKAGVYISTRANAARAQGKRWGCLLCRFLDWIKKDHCANSE